MTGWSGADLALSWEVVSNRLDGGRCLFEVTLENRGQQPLAAGGWQIYFNGVNVPESGSASGGVNVEHVNGDLYRVVPTAEFLGLFPGQRFSFRYIANAWALQATDAPRGAYLVFDEADAPTLVPLGDPGFLPLVRPEQLSRGADDQPVHDPARAFTENLRLEGVPAHALGSITPKPCAVRLTGKQFVLGRTTAIVHSPQLLTEATLLRASLVGLLGAELRLSTRPLPNAISLAVEPELEAPSGTRPGEAYRLEVTPSGVSIVGASAAAVFHGSQSLLQLLPVEIWSRPAASVPVIGCHVLDAPRYDYRGLLLDVARNFSSKATVLRLLDLMAFYKLNRLHLHLTDDEGWRLEIGALPELTSYGGRRAYSPKEVTCLPPSLGSGIAAQAPGSGCYSRQDFVEILRYAHARHIRIIPEIDLPGHARAAIKSMEARYRRLLALGEMAEAERYLLTDIDDRSEYKSNQGFYDNVLCVGMESCYDFIDVVVREIKAQYADAGAPLELLHVGGDEMPAGCWLGSPRCLDLMARQGLGSGRELRDYFYERLRSILQRQGLRLAGWEEIAVFSGENRVSEVAPDPKFVGARFVPYVWNNVLSAATADNEPVDLATRLAVAGYEVVLCDARHLYLDFAYERHPEEPGYYWAGYVNLQQVFDLAPKGPLLGLQAQLWGENLRSQSELEFLLLPRLLVLAERAWSQSSDFNELAGRLGGRELPRLDWLYGGFAYRVPVPGALLKDGMLYANSSLPRFELRYTTDGSAPSVASPRYEGPVPATQAKVAAFTTTGRRSRVVSV